MCERFLSKGMQAVASVNCHGFPGMYLFTFVLSFLYELWFHFHLSALLLYQVFFLLHPLHTKPYTT